MRLMLKIAVVGGAETVMGFKALGLEACPVANAEEARETLRRLTMWKKIWRRSFSTRSTNSKMFPSRPSS